MSRPVTIEELRRVLEAMRPKGDGVNRFTPLVDHDISLALAALPAEQEQPSDPHNSAVPELPPHFTAGPAVAFGTHDSVVPGKCYYTLRAAAEALREKLADALRGEADRAALLANVGRMLEEAKRERDKAVDDADRSEQLCGRWQQAHMRALVERDDAQHDACNQAQRAEQAEAERDALRDQVEQAQRRQEPLAWRCRIHGVTVRPACTDYRPGHDPECLPLYAAPVPAAEQADQSQRQEPWVWTGGQPPHPYGNEWFIAELRSGGRAVLRALPEHYAYDFTTEDSTHYKADAVARWMQFPDSSYRAYAATADVAQQIAAAEQRGRAQAFEEAADECASRHSNRPHDPVAAAHRRIVAWCRAKAEEARG